MYSPLEIGQRLALIESWSPAVLDAAINDFFDVDDGTINFNINRPRLAPNRLPFNFNDINSTMLAKRLIIRHPDIMEYFTVYKPLLVHYALDHNRDLREFGFNIPLDFLKEAIHWKLKTLNNLDYFLELLTMVSEHDESCDDDIVEILNYSHDKRFQLSIDMDCTYFLRLLKITKNKDTFKSIVYMLCNLTTHSRYIMHLQLEQSLASNEMIKEQIGFDCIEYFITLALKRGVSVDYIQQQIVVPEYQRVVNKYKLLHGNTMTT